MKKKAKKKTVVPRGAVVTPAKQKTLLTRELLEKYARDDVRVAGVTTAPRGTTVFFLAFFFLGEPSLLAMSQRTNAESSPMSVSQRRFLRPRAAASSLWCLKLTRYL